MQAKVTFNDDSFKELADDIELVDRTLRQSFSGLEVEAIKKEAGRSLSAVGMDLPDDQLTEYARSIREREDFEFVLE